MRRCFSSSTSTQFLKKFTGALVKTAPKEHIVQQVRRPIGLAIPPNSSNTYSKGNALRDMLDETKTSKRADELALELSRSGMYDVYTFRKTNGKLFFSPPGPWQAEKALYFPHLAGSTLRGGKEASVEDVMRDKLSIVKISSCEAGERLVDTFFSNGQVDYLSDTEALSRDTMTRDRVQIVEVLLAENWPKTALARLASGHRRAKVPEERHGRFFICNRNQLPFSIREELCINNPYTGYVVVVDGQLRIRWIGCGAASKEEFQTLWKSVRVLDKEMSESATHVFRNELDI